MDSSKGGSKLVPPGAVVKPFEMRVLGKESRPTYQAIKKNFSVDPSSPKDSRFLLSDMVHAHLSVEGEEERRFNERLQAEIARRETQSREKAQQEGFEKGQEEGRKQAFEEEKSRLAAVIEGTAHLLSTLGEAKT